MTTLPGPTRKESLPRKPRAVWGENGAAAIEFALVLPILVLLVCGIIEFGLMFYNKQMITNASREGARAGIVEGVGEDRIRAIVTDALRGTDGTSKIISLRGSIGITSAQVTIDRDEQNDLAVTVSFEYPLLLGGVIGIATTPVSAQTIMRMER